MRVAGDDASVLHFVDPVAGIGDETVMRDEQERFFAFAHHVRE